MKSKLVLLLGLLLVGCGKAAGGTDSNTNWITCERRSDCQPLGETYDCVDQLCVAPGLGGSGTGGSSSGGSSSGGTSSGGTSSGGTSSGGTSSGGTSSGGTSSGGSSSGGSSSGGTSSGGSSSGGSSTGGSSTGGTGNVDKGCPAQAPAPGAPCDENALPSAICSYGADPRPHCRTTATCQGGQWATVEKDCGPAWGDGCANANTGAQCSDQSLDCWNEDGRRCYCSGCVGGSGDPVCQTLPTPEWACSVPPDGCPNFIPQAGSACDSPGLNCGPNCELDVRCEDGVWKWQPGLCPICAAPDTPIATPDGERPIASLRPGDLVYSVEGSAIVVVPIVQVGSTPVRGHHVQRVTLESGRVLEISAGHPTSDGRTFADLAPGGRLADHLVVSVERVPYSHERTYDILPASSSGAYFAAGALIGSTLAEPSLRAGHALLAEAGAGASQCGGEAL